ncbi:MAG: alpha-xylosidase, partial [Candidatus Cryptobacteroides sp.]
MKLTTVLISTLPILALSASCSKPCTVDRQGVTVRLSAPAQNGPQLVRLQPQSENIVRVSATAERKFSDPQSLVIIHPDTSPEFSVSAEGDTVTLATSALRANVLSTTGQVWFTDLDGNVILSEQNGGGKEFTPIEVEGTKGWTWRQVFESEDDEAFYGLGQHQSDEFNYKGKNEELFQYNTKVSVPFVVSNKGYGILMDSYSMMRFGNPDGYSQLSEVFELYDKNGESGALTGTYT